MPERQLTAREAVWQGLVRMQNGAYSNLLLDSMLSSLSNEHERRFASSLFYGVLEREITLIHDIEYLTSKPVSKIDIEVLSAIEIALYQILYMDSIPNSAAVNESVNIIKHSKKKSAAGFVNGVLRTFLRKNGIIPMPTDPIANASVQYSMPIWILTLWAKDYGDETAINLAKACLGRPPIQIRVNTLKTSCSQVLSELIDNGLEAVKHPLLKDALTISNTGAIGELPAIKEGLCYVQDIASQLCAAAVDPQPNERIFDLCAAPGGKSFTMAQLMSDNGQLFSFDLYSHRTNLIRDGAERLGLHSIYTRSGDASKFDASIGTADRVLCDVPCSGLGVIRRKPEIRRKTREEISDLPVIQKRILNNAAQYVRPGGILVYSTCSLNKEENDAQSEAFLASHPNFEPDMLPKIFKEIIHEDKHSVTLMPTNGEFDGFYIARFKKRV